MNTKDLTLNIPSGASSKTFAVELTGHVVVTAAKDAAARLVLRSSKHRSGRAEVEFHVAEGARLEIVSLYETNESSAEEMNWEFHLGHDAKVNYTDIIVGTGTVQSNVKVMLEAPGASVHLNGLSVLGGSAQMRNETVVVHDAPDTVSRQRFKDILTGSARSEYSGLVHVKREALRSDSQQICRNLLLSKNARAMSRPQLKIDTDDVKCSHGSATGELSQAEVFYLRSRGLSLNAARAMLIEGFAEEIVLELPEGDKALRTEAHQIVRRELEEVLR